MLKFITNFFTHWTKKKIIITAISAFMLVGVSFGAYTMIGGGGGQDSLEEPEHSENTVLDRPSDKTVADFLASEEDYRANLYISQGELKRAGSFKSVSSGKTVSMGVTQNILATRYVSGKSAYKESLSFGMVKLGDRRFASAGNYVYRKAEKVKSADDVTWAEGAQTLSEDAFNERYGCIGNELCGYILKDETILNAEYLGYDENSGLYTFAYDLDVVGATYFVLHEMKTNAGTAKYPEFIKARIIVAMNDEWRVATLTTDCEYKVALLGGVNCKEDMTETFSDFGAYPKAEDLPEYEYFSKYFGSTPIDEDDDAEPTALDVVMSMFADYMGDKKLNAALTITEGNAKSAPVKAFVTANIDIENPENITVLAKIGGENARDNAENGNLVVSYGGGLIGLSYGEFKTTLSLDDETLSIFKGLLGGETEFDAEKILDGMKLEIVGEDCRVEIPLELGETKIEAILFGKVSGEDYVFTDASVKVGDKINLTAEITDEQVAEPDMNGAPDAKELLASLLTENTGLKAELGENSLNLTLDPVNKAINAAFGDISVSVKDGFAYLTAGDGKWKLDYAPIVDIIKDRFAGDGENVDITFSEVLGLLSRIKTEKIVGGSRVYADFNGISLSVEFGKTGNGALKINALRADVKGALKIESCAETVETPANLNEYKLVENQEYIKDTIPVVLDALTGEKTLSFGVKVNGVEINGYAAINFAEKTISAYCPNVFGASLAVSAGLNGAYLTYGKINLNIKFNGVEDLVGEIKEIISAVSSSSEVKLDGVSVESIINAIFGGMEKTETENGYDLSFGLPVNSDIVNVVVKVENKAFKGISVDCGDISVSAEVCDNAEIILPDAENSSDMLSLVKTLLPKVKELINANGYRLNLENAEISLGETRIALNGSALIEKTDGGVNLKLQAAVALNGGKFVKADVTLAEGRLYGEVNGFKFAVELGESKEKGKIEISALKGYNEYLDEIVSLIENISAIDFKTIEYGKLINSLSFADGKLTLGINGGIFGIGDNISVKATFGEEVTAEISGITFGGVKLAVKAGVSASGERVIAPAGDYSTQFTVSIDKENVVYAKLDLLAGVYEFNLENTSESSEKVNLYAKYADGEIYLRSGATYAKCDISDMKEIIEELIALAHPERKSRATYSADGSADFIKELVASLEINGTRLTAAVPEIMGLINIDLAFDVSGEYDTTLSAFIAELDKTVYITCGSADEYENFDQSNVYVDIARVFGDYFETLKNLVTVGENGVKGWRFEVDAVSAEIKGNKYEIEPFTVDLQISPDKIRVFSGDISINGKKPFVIDVLLTTGDDGAIYITYNDKTNEQSSLKFSINKTTLSDIVEKWLPQVLEAVPQLGDLANGKIGLSQLVNLATLVGDVTYENDELSVTVSGEAFVKGLGNVTLKFNRNGESGIRADITSDGESIKINSFGAGVAVNENIAVAEDLSAYDIDNHFDLNSVETLLRSFVTTAKRTSFYLKGNVPVNLNALGIVNADINIGIDCRVDIEKDENGKDVVYVAAKLSRGELSGLVTVAFNDYGGDSYIYYNGKTGQITVKRNSYDAHTYCSYKTCQKYGCTNGWHTGWHKTHYKYDSEFGACSYDVTVSEEEFKEGLVDYLLEMVNFIDSIKNAIKGADSNKAYGIDDVITGYGYGEEEKAFNVTVNLNAIDDVLGDCNVNIYHDEDFNLTKLDGNITLLKVSGVSCKGSFSITLEESSFGTAKTFVESRELF